MWRMQRYLSMISALVVGMGSVSTASAEDKSALPKELANQASVQSAQVIQVPRRDTVIRRGETVTNRARPELDPLGARLGSFLVFPSLDVSEEYSDNIFATDDDEESDFITRIRPALRINSDWSNHELRFEGSGDIGRYLDNDNEDFEDFDVGVSGRLDVRRSTNLRSRIRYQKEHEERGSPDDVNGVEPTEYDVFSAELQGFHNFGRVNLTLGGSYRSLDFDDVSSSTGIINNDDRDRDILEGYVRGGYEIVPSYEAFVRGAYNIRDYDSEIGDDPANPLDRDSEGFEFVGGLEVDFGGLIFGDFFVGYESQDYDDAQLNTIDGPTVGAEITWNVTPLTTIVGSVERAIVETTTPSTSGRFLTTGRLSVDHELLRNLLLGANFSVTNDDFEGIERTDWYYVAGIGATYMLNRNFYVSGGYTFRTRNAEVSTDDYSENLFMVRLRAQY